MGTATGILICLIFGSGCWSGLASAEKSEKNEQAEDRIVGGDPASAGEYPWLVSLHEDGEFICGGSILNQFTILTTADCVNGADADSITIRAGNLIQGKRDYFEQRIPVKKITHRYYEYGPNWDIAVLKLKKRLIFNRSVYSINLASPWKDDALTDINNCVVAGYGTINNKGTMAKRLREVEAKIASRTYCKRYVEENISEYGVFNKRFLCTQDYDKGSCYGDGGSPLVCFDAYDNPYQLGILSYGSIDCFLGFNVYIRVSEFLSWIDNLS